MAIKSHGWGVVGVGWQPGRTWLSISAKGSGGDFSQEGHFQAHNCEEREAELGRGRGTRNS